MINIGKHSSLLQYGKNYCNKKFYSTGSCSEAEFLVRCPGHLQLITNFYPLVNNF
jgi:hypothetical protein